MNKPEPKPMILPTDSAVRKQIPITTGLLDYFPRACAAVAQCSYAGNQQHHPDKPLHWDKSKSADHADCISRHLIDRNSKDTDNHWHATKLAWRALANLEVFLEEQEKLEKEQTKDKPEPKFKVHDEVIVHCSFIGIVKSVTRITDEEKDDFFLYVVSTPSGFEVLSDCNLDLYEEAK